jgi:uncharacterized membrane protein YfcA
MKHIDYRRLIICFFVTCLIVILSVIIGSMIGILTSLILIYFDRIALVIIAILLILGLTTHLYKHNNVE